MYYSPSRILWVFSAQRKFSMLKIIPCNIIFTPDKIILAYLTPELRKKESIKLSEDIKERGIGFLKGTREKMRYWSDFHRRYYSVTVNEALAEDPINTEIYNQNISKVLFRGYRQTLTSVGDDVTSNVRSGKLQFTLEGGEIIKFTHNIKSSQDIKEQLITLFGDRLKYKK